MEKLAIKQDEKSMTPYSIIFLYGFAFLCFEAVYLCVVTCIHVLASSLNSWSDGLLSVYVPYLIACLAGFFGVFFGLKVAKAFFKSIELKVIVTIYYTIVAIILIITGLAYLFSVSSEATGPSRALVQVFVSVVSAWYLSEHD